MMKNNLKDSKLQKLSGIRKRTENFMNKVGRRPRILVTTVGEEKHDTTLRAIASSYADYGFDVDINTLSQTPQLIARAAIEIDVHLIVLSTSPGSYKTVVPEISQELENMGGEEIKIIIVGDVPEEDHQVLFDAGVVEIISTLTLDTDSVNRVLDILEHRR